MAAQEVDGGVVKEEGGRDGEADPFGEPLAQTDPHNGSEAELEERHGGVNGRRVEVDHGRHHLHDLSTYGIAPCPRRQDGTAGATTATTATTVVHYQR